MKPIRVLAFLCLVPVTVELNAYAATATGWDVVQALAPHAHVEVKTDTLKSDCHVATVTVDKLTCDEASFSRAEIKSIRRVERSKSTLAGMGIGAGIGAGAGAGIGAAVNAGDSGSYLHVSNAKPVGIGAALGIIFGGATGAIVGHSHNYFATTIYKR